MDSEFSSVAARETHPAWETFIHRERELYSRHDDVRSPFARDYTRILHSTAFRRLKHKTQVYFNIENDHICTRMEHVIHVESVADTIARRLGLNDELTRAIAMGHDLGHPPFGHQGEKVLSEISKEYLDEAFWHERNGLRFVDSIELLEDNYNLSRNLNLTYAVRDGIISHCGEVDGNGLRPREEYIDLERFEEAGQYEPATWEGCVVKLADKIAYVGRDIEDAKSLGLLSEEAKRRLLELARINDQKVMNTTVIMHNLIIDVCQNSSVDRGICLSEAFSAQLNEVKKFNYQYIYESKRFQPFIHYSTFVLRELFEFLYGTYDRDVPKIWANLSENRPFARQLVESFEGWLARYVEPSIVPDRLRGEYETCQNQKIYGQIENEKTFARAVIDFIAGMTDRFAVKVYEELLNY